MKTFLKFLLALLFVLALLVVGATAFADRAVKKVVEVGASDSLGVPTTLAGVKLDLRHGALELTELSVQNPEGFPDPELLRLERAQLEVEPRSLLQDVVHVPVVLFEGIHVTLDRAGARTNFEAILDNLERSRGTEEADPESTKRLRIDLLRITGARATIALGSLPGAAGGADAGRIEVELAPIELRDLDGGGEGLPIGQIARQVVQVLLESTVSASGASIPADLRAQLEGAVGDARNRFEDLEKQIESIEEQLEGAGKELEKGLGGLIPKKASDE